MPNHREGHDAEPPTISILRDGAMSDAERIERLLPLVHEQLRAAALGVSAPTVKRAWAFARGWLEDAIENDRQ